ncbi:MAG: hypothetical protein K0R12_1212 [Gammaproteobacteria bacterium]|jgi:ribosome-associated translation inhibitor RaiA|nr:hypothetical protein [Gammaproteobacteria bacterium]
MESKENTFFPEEYADKAKELLETLKGDMESIITSVLEKGIINADERKHFQNKLVSFNTLKTFVNIKNNPLLKRETDRVLLKHCDFGDHRDTHSIKDLLTNKILPRIFETAMADLIERKFGSVFEKHIKKQGNPDFVLTVNKVKYVLECTITRSDPRNKYVIDALVQFQPWFEAAKLIFEKFEQNRAKYQRNPYVKWYSLPDHVIKRDIEEQKEKFINMLSKTSLEESSKYFEEILEGIIHTLIHYREFICDEMNKQLESIDLIPDKIVKSSNNFPSTYWADILYSHIADKIEKSAFKRNMPVILAISFSLRKDALTAHTSIRSWLKAIKENLETRLTKLMKDAPQLENLYALIIDTTFYNWFPSHAEKEYGAKFSNGFDNEFICFYNAKNEMVIKQKEQGTLIFNNLMPNVDFLDILETECQVI